MVVCVAVFALGNMLEAMVVQLAEETGVAVVSKELLQDLSLLQALGYHDLEGASVRQPANPPRQLLVRQNPVDLLREGHVLNGLGLDVVERGGHIGKVAVRVVHERLGFFHDLYDTRLHRILVLHLGGAAHTTLGRGLGICLAGLERREGGSGNGFVFHGRRCGCSRKPKTAERPTEIFLLLLPGRSRFFGAMDAQLWPTTPLYRLYGRYGKHDSW